MIMIAFKYLLFLIAIVFNFALYSGASVFARAVYDNSKNEGVYSTVFGGLMCLFVFLCSVLLSVTIILRVMS